MCGRFVQYSHPEVYARHFDAPLACEGPAPRYNLAPTQPVLAVRQTQGTEREIVALRWGLMPPWSRGSDNRYSMINARAETVDSKPAYRNALRYRRCIIPSEGFYEWKAAERGKTPYLIRRKDGAPFGMAGLWERWRRPDGGAIESCTLIVTDANNLVRRLHDRMPVILAPEDYGPWLDPKTTDANRLRSLLRPAEPTAWELHQVSRKVNSPRNEGPDLLEAPIAA